jgi:SAM-dependent methyltransferase
LDEFKFPKTIRILVVGCGSSEFSENMYDEGYENIVNIDTSEVVIKDMKERNKKREQMICMGLFLILDEIMDVRDLKFENLSFDLVIDKGTLDNIFCIKQAFLNVAIYSKEISRVLKDNGIYFLVSFGDPESRVFHLVKFK